MREETFLWHEAKYNYQGDMLLLRPHTSAGLGEKKKKEKKRQFMDGEKKLRSPGAKSSEMSSASRLVVSQGSKVP